MKPILFATQAKGLSAFLKRSCSITSRYGITSRRMDQSLHLFTKILRQFDCGASFALTAIVLERHGDIINKYLDQNVEFIVHGYTHIDYSQLPPEEQVAHLYRAREIFADAGITVTGFRSPYLRCASHLNTAIETTGFSYACNQPIIWDVLNIAGLPPSAYHSYERAINFYTPWSANERSSLPRLYNNLVEIPVSLPDDEIILDRLQDTSNIAIKQVWQRILSETYQREELFTVQLHPERIALCERALSAVLSKAHTLTPSVWIARLDEVDTWWRARATTKVSVSEITDNTWRLSVIGPSEITILARGVEITEPTKPWADNYQRIMTATSMIRAPCYPFIGVSPVCPQTLTSFLHQQGYIFQISENSRPYSVYFNQSNFDSKDECSVLAQIEQNAQSLVRLGHWPNGARSALCVTGDIDALTLWDYGWRLFGR